ncbi:MAG TPA: hypothetical protein VGM68_07580 [Rhizomicrobium sp.]|jgi:hypothetical protein
MRIPARIAERPIETAIASLLLLGLLLGSADFTSTTAPPGTPSAAMAQKL